MQISLQVSRRGSPVSWILLLGSLFVLLDPVPEFPLHPAFPFRDIQPAHEKAPARFDERAKPFLPFIDSRSRVENPDRGSGSEPIKREVHLLFNLIACYALFRLNKYMVEISHDAPPPRRLRSPAAGVYLNLAPEWSPFLQVKG